MLWACPKGCPKLDAKACCSRAAAAWRRRQPSQRHAHSTLRDPTLAASTAGSGGGRRSTKGRSGTSFGPRARYDGSSASPGPRMSLHMNTSLMQRAEFLSRSRKWRVTGSYFRPRTSVHVRPAATAEEAAEAADAGLRADGPVMPTPPGVTPDVPPAVLLLSAASRGALSRRRRETDPPPDTCALAPREAAATRRSRAAHRAHDLRRAALRE